MFRGRVRRLHFIGIGGVGMSGIAEVLVTMGFEVQGSDLREGESVVHLRELGAKIVIGHASENVEGANVVVRSTAVGEDNPEVKAAHQLGIPVIPRAEMLAELMRLKHGIAVAGSHGKTTTTSLLAAVLHEGGIDPTVVIGGKVNHLGSNARLGEGDYLLAEADESDGSFLKLSPTLAIVTNLDLEHIDFWQGGLPQLQDAFVQFLERLPFYGLAVVCIDEENVQKLLPRVSRRISTYGLSRQAQWRARDIRYEGVSSAFEVLFEGELQGEIRLALVGEHNVMNALASIALATELGVSFEQCQRALENFEGVQRRFTLRGEVGGVTVIDDYGHHPRELRATLRAARLAYVGRRVIAFFQPHRYTRTHAFLDDFARSFNDADVVMLTDVYAAGEERIEGADSQSLRVRAMEFGHHGIEQVVAVDKGASALAKLAQEGDVVLTLGAGSVTQVSTSLLALLEAKPS
ncbi:MAG: UDP-N-acetylmuramate--L-alanine ligase [Deltaproteobacteria bacterium]|nr:UDP-N-acetylmuramate--L-alanine ligase [Deltaproteobacteria bacterium]